MQQAAKDTTIWLRSDRRHTEQGTIIKISWRTIQPDSMPAVVRIV
jgi:hypothetical protein